MAATSGELTLAQIAARTGYASPYAFAATFRRHHGQPPASGANESWTDAPSIRQRPSTTSTPDDGAGFAQWARDHADDYR